MTFREILIESIPPGADKQNGEEYAAATEVNPECAPSRPPELNRRRLRRSRLKSTRFYVGRMYHLEASCSEN